MILRNPRHRSRRHPPQQSARSILQQISEVVHNPDRERFELWVAGDLVGVLGYRVDLDQTVTILHTVLYDEYSGHGLATRLTGQAMGHFRNAGLRVRPLCTFTKQYIDAHPEAVALAPV